MTEVTHKAISLRSVLSEGKVNIFSLAKNPDIAVTHIEKFYAHCPPMSGEMA